VNVRWLCLRPPDQLNDVERGALEEILNEDERLACGYRLLQRFRRVIARRSVRDLVMWLADALESGLRPFASLARGIQADYAAVVNGLKLPWSTGPVVDHHDESASLAAFHQVALGHFTTKH
jgi:transposase